jgi:hypothetical protein
LSRSDQLLSEAEDGVEVKELRRVSGTTNRLSLDDWSSTAVGWGAGTNMGEMPSAGKGTLSLTAVGTVAGNNQGGVLGTGTGKVRGLVRAGLSWVGVE